MQRLQVLVILVGLFCGHVAVSTIPPVPTTQPTTVPSVTYESCSDTVCMIQQFTQQFLLVLQQIFEAMGNTFQQYTMSSP